MTPPNSRRIVCLSLLALSAAVVAVGPAAADAPTVTDASTAADASTAGGQSAAGPNGTPQNHSACDPDKNSCIDLSLWRAPESVAGASDTGSDVTAGIEDGNVTPAEHVTPGDLLLIDATVPNLQDIVQSREGETRAAALRNLFANGTLSLSIEQVPETVSLEKQPKYLLVNASADALTVVPGDDANELVIVANTTGLRFQWTDFPREETMMLSPGDAYNATVTVSHPSATVSNGSGTAQFEVAERAVAVEDDPDWLLNRSGQRIRGYATAAPGTRHSLTLRGPDFREHRTVTVTRNNTFATTVDLSGLEPGERLRAIVTGDVDTDTATFPVRSAPPDARASVSVPNQTVEARPIAVDRFETNYGGFAVVHEGTADGRILGASNYIVGNASQVAVGLDREGNQTTDIVVVAHRDTDGDEEFDAAAGTDRPYRTNGSVVADSAVLTVADPTASPPSPPTTVETRSPTTTPGMTETPPSSTNAPESPAQASGTSATTAPSGGTASGDGALPPLPVVLAALLSGIALGGHLVRRRDSR